jgi:hypothetical protein
MREELTNLHLKEIDNKSNSKYKGVLSLVALEGAKDFATGQMLENARTNNQDHVFPKAETRGFGSAKYVNSVLNMTWLSAETNKIKSFKKPSVYIQDLISGTCAGNEEKFLEVLKTHLITKEAYRAMLDNNFELFLLEREESIISKIAEHLGVVIDNVGKIKGTEQKDLAYELISKKATIQISQIQTENIVYTLSNQILCLLGECNKICSSKGKEEIFKPTNTMVQKIADIGKPVRNESDFGNMIDALYQVIYEGSGNLSRIPTELKKEDSLGIAIKYLRNDLRHDLEHGDLKEIVAKRIRIAKIYENYTMKTTIASLDPEEFPRLQIAILNNLKTFLENLKQNCTSL